MMFQHECVACGLSVHDLPDPMGDLEFLRDQFFAFDDGGDLYCVGCADNGWGAFL